MRNLPNLGRIKAATDKPVGVASESFSLIVGIMAVAVILMAYIQTKAPVTYGTPSVRYFDN